MNFSIHSFYQKSINLIKKNPKLLLLGIASLMLIANTGRGLRVNPRHFSPSQTDDIEEGRQIDHQSDLKQEPSRQHEGQLDQNKQNKTQLGSLADNSIATDEDKKQAAVTSDTASKSITDQISLDEIQKMLDNPEYLDQLELSDEELEMLALLGTLNEEELSTYLEQLNKFLESDQITNQKENSNQSEELQTRPSTTNPTDILSTLSSDLKNEDSLIVEGLTNNLEQNNLQLMTSVAAVLRVVTTFAETLKKIPSWIYFFFGIQILVFFLGTIVLSLAISAWIQAAMIKGISLAETIGGNRWKLSTAARHALSRVKSMIWINIVPLFSLLFWVALMIVALLITFLITSSISTSVIGLSSSQSFLAILLRLITIAAVTFVFLKTILTIIFGQTIGKRFVVLNSLSGKAAFEQAKRQIKKYKSVRKLATLAISHFLIFSVLLPLTALSPLIITLVVFVRLSISKIQSLKIHHLQPQFQIYFQAIQEVFFSVPFVWTVSLVSSFIIALIAMTAVSILTHTITNCNWHWAYRLLDRELDLESDAKTQQKHDKPIKKQS